MDPLKPRELVVSFNENNTTIQLNVSFKIFILLDRQNCIKESKDVCVQIMSMNFLSRKEENVFKSEIFVGCLWCY